MIVEGGLVSHSAPRFGLLLAAVVLTGCGVPDADTGAATDPDGRQILEGAARAMGAEAVASVHTVAAEADVRGPGGAFETVLYSARDGRVRMMQTTGFHAGLAPSGDWIQPSIEEGPQPLPAEIREVVIGHELHMIFIDPESRYEDPEALLPSTLDGRPILPVRVLGEQGRFVVLYYDARDTLPVGMRIETAVGEVAVEVSDWRLLDDLRLFWSAVFRDDSGSFEYAYRDLRVNETPDEMFLPNGGSSQER
jgi:hypothetical protein